MFNLTLKLVMRNGKHYMTTSQNKNMFVFVLETKDVCVNIYIYLKVFFDNFISSQV